MYATRGHAGRTHVYRLSESESKHRFGGENAEMRRAPAAPVAQAAPKSTARMHYGNSTKSDSADIDVYT